MNKPKWTWRIVISTGLILLTAALIAVRAWADHTGSTLNPLQWAAETTDNAQRQSLNEVFGETDAALIATGNSTIIGDQQPQLADSARFDKLTGEITVLPERVEEPDLEGAPKVVPILEIPSPALQGPKYVVVGEVKYENVGGRGYLEMWSDFRNLGAESQIQLELDLQGQKVKQAEEALQEYLSKAAEKAGVTVEEARARELKNDAYVRLKNDLTQEKAILHAATESYERNILHSTPKYFTRTLGFEGPMAHLSGSIDWRPFALPFDATGIQRETMTTGRPVGDETGPLPLRELEINVVLPNEGEVRLRNLRLLDQPFQGNIQTLLKQDREKTMVQEASESFSNAWGGSSQRLVQMWTILTGGCLLVPLALALNGQGRAVIVVLAWVYGVFSGVLLALGSLFLILGWPFSQFLPLLMCGVTGLILPLLLLPLVTRMCEERELRKMSVRDAQSMI